MSNAWNFERRRIVCARFLVGVSLVTKAAPDAATSLEAVRNRVRLPPEDALFAARRLHDEQSIVFDPAGPVQSTSRGIARAAEIVRTAASGARRCDDAARTVRDGGIPLEMLKLALLVHGGVLHCDAPESDASAVYRLVLANEAVALERQCADGTFAPVEDPG